MFTGIVDRVGHVREVSPLAGGLRIVIEADAAYLAPVAVGGSIAVDGVCQTLVRHDGACFVVEAIGTTLSRTTFGRFVPGRAVNLERPLALGGVLGGHLVQGHVDAVGTVHAVEHRGEHVLLDVSMPPEVADVTVLHGSIAVNGVSLTVNELPGPDVFQVALIPHTWERTNLAGLAPGDGVNLEGDMIGRFVVHYLQRRGGSGV
ncbi:MAG TPA: riboflavin synthase [Longimicrobiales bacterium]|nr:riboflavin synthase [Longimicrobiales bacterium]